MQLEYEPDHHGTQRCQEKKRMTDSPVIREVAHGIAQRNEDVKIGKRPAQRAPRDGLPAHLPAQDRFPDGGPQCKLGQGIQGCLSVRWKHGPRLKSSRGWPIILVEIMRFRWTEILENRHCDRCHSGESPQMGFAG